MNHETYMAGLALRELFRGWKAGVLFRWGSAWIGGHWSSFNRRICINPVPFITVWVALPGGNTP